MKPTDFAIRLSAFFTVHLAGRFGASVNTIKSYRDTFVLLLRFLADQRGIKPERIRWDSLGAATVIEFLDHLEKHRHCSARTRNQRLAAIHSFFRYVQIEEPEVMQQAQRVLAIPFARFEKRPVEHLTADEVGLILAQPDRQHRRGRRDAVIMGVLYDSGARCQELLDLRVRDIRLDPPAQVRLTGKGRHTRFVPLMANTVSVLRDYLRECGLDQRERADEPLFQGRYGRPLSRSGIRGILERHLTRARKERPILRAKMGPHVLRHTKAMHLLQAGTHPIFIRDILGHADIRTTEVYARADMEMKRKALEKVADVPPRGPEARPWHDDPDLVAWLAAL